MFDARATMGDLGHSSGCFFTFGDCSSHRSGKETGSKGNWRYIDRYYRVDCGQYIGDFYWCNSAGQFDDGRGICGSRNTRCYNASVNVSYYEMTIAKKALPSKGEPFYLVRPVSARSKG